MIRTIPLKIQNEYITGDKGMIGAAGSHNDVILRMEFSGMWDGLTKMVQFRDALGEATIEVLLTADMLEADDTSVYLVPVPNGAKKYAGEMTLCIKGAAVSAQKETRATLAVYGRFTVAESKWSAEAETEADVPASNVEQLQGQIENVLATIVDARKAATEAAKSAEGAALSQSRAQTSEQYAGEYAQDAADSATAAANSAASASGSAASAAESIKHAPRINSYGKWELWDATTNAYVATEYTAIGEDGTKWWTYAYPIGITAALENIMSKSNLPDAAIGDYVLHTMSNAGIVFEITGETADGISWVVKEKCTLRGKNGTTPHIGENGNWYIGDADTGVSADHIFKVIVVDGPEGPDTLSADKTFAEIKSAYTAGNIVVVLHGSALYELTYMGDVRAEFTRVNVTYYEVMSCTNSGAPQEVDGWQLNRTKRINYDTKYGDIGNKTVPVAIKELQDKSAPAVTDTDAGKYLHVNSSTKELEWAAAEAATHETAGIVKPSADFDIAEDGTLSLYKAIAVNSLTLNKDAVYEIGTEVTGLDVAWALNKAPAEQTITVPEYAVTIENIGADVRSTTGLTGNDATQWNGVKTQEKTSGTLTVTLTVKDDRGAAASKTASIQWLNGVYTGAAAAPAAIDSAFIRTLTKSLQSGKGKTFTVNAATGAYIWYACPVRYGTPNFNVGGFDGGFSKVATFDFTNSSGYTEEYHVWRSDNAGLGSTTVKVS